MIRRVTVEDMLAARDARAARQADFLRRHSMSLVSFTMNIAGDVKVDDAIRRAFSVGVSRIRRELCRLNATVADYAETNAFTGCEALWAVDVAADVLKARMCRIEEHDALGRLFDIDVIGADGNRLTRERERPCLICDGPVRVCARSRQHSAEALFTRAQEIITAHCREEFVRRIGEAAQKALLFEALTTPKPGLVDCRNTGAHRDMDMFSFAASASVLRPYFEMCVRIGLQGGSPEQLQYSGMLAEDAMLSAAGANTHKGAIFSLGILSGAIGRCGEYASLDAVLEQAGEIGQYFLQQMTSSAQTSTGGEQQYLLYGLTGARGEAASGFRSVREIALPVLEECLNQGASVSAAGKAALLHLMARVMDSNVIRRGGMAEQTWMMEKASQLLQNGYTDEDLLAFDAEMIRRNISPGGSADLLAAAWFLHFIKQMNNNPDRGAMNNE